MTQKGGDIFPAMCWPTAPAAGAIRLNAIPPQLRDVRNELLSPAKALADYGVAIEQAQGWTVDTAATEARRAEIAKARGWTETPKVQWHDPALLGPGGGVTDMTVSYRVGVDIGGTFTDIVLLGSDGTIHQEDLRASATTPRRSSTV